MNSTILKKQLKLAIGHACKNLRTFPSCIESRPQNNSRAAMMNFWKKKKKRILLSQDTHCACESICRLPFLGEVKLSS